MRESFDHGTLSAYRQARPRVGVEQVLTNASRQRERENETGDSGRKRKEQKKKNSPGRELCLTRQGVVGGNHGDRVLAYVIDCSISWPPSRSHDGLVYWQKKKKKKKLGRANSSVRGSETH